MDVLAIAFGIVGGLAVFLYGLYMLSDGLKKVVGEKIKQLLARLTNNPLKGCFFGALTAATLQSSGLTMVILIGLINASVLTLSQGIGVMLGSEIGTTITAQIVASNVGIIFLPIIAFGFLLSILAKNKRYRNIGQVILSLGLVYLGMNIMSSSIQPLQDEPALKAFLYNLGQFPLSGLLGGVIVTSIFNSSTALMGLVISLGINNLITLEAAIAIILGANIGSCVTGIIAAVGSSLSSKRLSLTQLVINIIGVSLFFPFITNFAGLIAMTSGNLPRQIANAHSVFNITVTLIMLPSVSFLVSFVKRLLPGEEIKIKRGTEFIDEKLLAAPSIALSQAEKEVLRIGNLTYEMLDKAISAIQNNKKETIAKVMELEGIVDEIYHAIDKFLDDSRFVNLSEKELKKLAYLKHSATDIERVGDHANNLAELAEKKLKKALPFSEDAEEELTTICVKTKMIYEKALIALEGENKEVVKTVQELEDEIDRLQRVFEANHIRRLKYKMYDPLVGIIFVDILRNLERVADHSTNIANAILLGF
ncbi:MAG: Na/Pi cotransporter family protein [Candidatus Bathyarchaeota archaeon]|nr:Na/Pi cotransporter family protein [Candidatus Bathyarchaeota archaeon]MDH5636008.1 Na/Pi cotransporter family protein [Candidatus Bathyarchaeota archaeon]